MSYRSQIGREEVGCADSKSRKEENEPDNQTDKNDGSKRFVLAEVIADIIDIEKRIRWRALGFDMSTLVQRGNRSWMALKTTDIRESAHKNKTYRTPSSVAKNSPIRGGCDASYKIPLRRLAELRGCKWFCVYLLLDQRMQLITNIKTNIDLAAALDMAARWKR